MGLFTSTHIERSTVDACFFKALKQLLGPVLNTRTSKGCFDYLVNYIFRVIIWRRRRLNNDIHNHVYDAGERCCYLSRL